VLEVAIGNATIEGAASDYNEVNIFENAFYRNSECAENLHQHVPMASPTTFNSKGCPDRFPRDLDAAFGRGIVRPLQCDLALHQQHLHYPLQQAKRRGAKRWPQIATRCRMFEDFAPA